MRSLLVLLLTISGTATALAETPAPISNDQDSIRPILETYCFPCHGPEKQKAKLRLDTLPTNFQDDASLQDDASFQDSASIETWHDVLNKLNSGDMPPERAKQPEPEELSTLVEWLTAELEQVRKRQRSTGGRAVLRRMTRYEYANTLRDLLGIDAEFGADLPPESTSPDGFKNNGAVLGMSPIQLEYYLATARSALQRTIVTGPRPETFEHFAEKSGTAKRNKKNAPASNRLEPGTRFLTRALSFPRVGDVRVTVRARAEIPDQAPFPRLRVTLGVRSDVKSFDKTLGEVDLVQSSKDASTFEFHGRIEDFPLPGHNPKYPGLVINVWHLGPDGLLTAKKKQKKAKRNAEADPVEADLEQAIVFIESVRFEGPLFDAWPPSRHQRILFDSESKDDEPKYAREVLTRFTRRAYRRRPESTEIDVLASFFAAVRPRFDSFEEAIRETLAMALISPSFLYLIEARKDGEERRRLTDNELATRLSFFLWSTMPDEELFALADRGDLRDAAKLERHVRSMIKDTRSRQFVEHFTSQWLDLSGLDRIAVNPEYYPDFDERLKDDMRAETLGFFAEILEKDLSALQLIDSDFTIVNRRLAKHYGIDGPRGNAFERVALGQTSRRGGLLTHGSVLLINSNGEDSHPIKRGVWLRDRILGDPPAPPPPDVPELTSEEPNFAKLSLKDQLELHRTKPACNACHKGIDPWGVPFENYDAVGRWRENIERVIKRRRKRMVPVEASSVLPDGTELADLDALKKHLLTKERHRFARALVEKLLSYALARSLEIGDDAIVDALTKKFEDSGYKLSQLIIGLVASEPFQSN